MADSMYKSAVNVFKLVDVEGVVLSVGESITINEPEGMDTANIRLERTPYHGCDFDFFDEESELLFDQVKYTGETYSGNSLIDAIYAVKGTDARISFQYYRTTTPDLIYDSELILSSRVKTALGTQCRAKRVDFDENFKNRYNVKYDLNRTTDLNGGSITPPTYQDIILMPQSVVREVENKKEDTEEIADVSIPSRYGIINFGDQLYNSFSQQLITYPSTLGYFKIFDILEFGFYQFDYSFDITFKANGGCVPTFTIVIVNDINNSSSRRSTDSRNIGGSTFGALSTTEQDWEVTSSTSSWANKGQRVYAFLDTNTASYEFNTLKVRETSFKISAVIKSGFISTKYIPIKDVFSSLLQGITGINDAVNSDFLDLQNAAILSGKLVRGFPETEPFYCDYSILSNMLSSLFGCGYYVSNNGTNNELNINKYSLFYQNKEIISLSDGIKEFDVSVEKDLIFNELNIGYNDYAKGNNTSLLINSNTDFLSEHGYSSPIRKDKKQLKYKCPVIASGQVIEEGKRQLYTLYGNEKWNHDDDLFIVDLAEQSTVYDQIVTLYKEERGAFQDQYYFIIENYLPQAVDATTIYYNTTSSTYTIGSVVWPGPMPPSNIELNIDNNTTTIYITEDLGFSDPTGIVIGGLQMDVLFDNVWTSPASSEAFDTFNGFTDINATYNARYNPKYMMMANSLILNSGLYYKDSTEKYILTSYENSSAGVTKFKTGEAYSTLDPDLETTTIGADITIEKLNQGNMLFIPELITFEIRITFTQIMYIREAMTGVNADDVNFGYITVINDGITYKGFLKSMDYNPLIGMCTFVLIRKFE